MKTCSKCSCSFEPYTKKCNLCRPCKRLYDREYHAARSADKKKAKAEKQTLLRRVTRQYVLDFLKASHCEICGETDYVVLEFDHIDRDSKRDTVSQLTRCSLGSVKEEIAKCRVLCANCHRRHSAKQLGWYQDLDT